MNADDDAAIAAAIAALPPLRDVIAAHDLGARKGLGQHFLLDLNLTARIARSAGDLKGATVIEVGPGPGGLTRALLAAGAARIVAIEKDPRCIAALQPLVEAARGRLVLREADALDADESDLAPGRGVHIVSNLPYNVGTVLVVKWLSQIAADPGRYAGLTLLLQKEVSARLTATPRSKAYGRLSVMCGWLTDAVASFDIGARAFTPPPKVDSTVVCLRPLPERRAEATWDDMETVLRAAFGQRRKMLRASLKSLFGSAAEEILAHAGIKETARAEELSVADFAALARARQAGGATGLRAGA
jgi:16S rRNA (adenine1518-N6/adenine1519-N6)-dimethyltransferase